MLRAELGISANSERRRWFITGGETLVEGAFGNAPSKRLRSLDTHSVILNLGVNVLRRRCLFVEKRTAG
jgi:hypothetical protein